jgi:hypothetical protein
MGYTLRKSKIAMEQYGQSLTPLQPPIYKRLSSHVEVEAVGSWENSQLPLIVIPSPLILNTPESMV